MVSLGEVLSTRVGPQCVVPPSLGSTTRLPGHSTPLQVQVDLGTFLLIAVPPGTQWPSYPQPSHEGQGTFQRTEKINGDILRASGALNLSNTTTKVWN